MQYAIQNEKSANVAFTYICAYRWVGLRLDLVVLLVSLTGSGMCMYLRHTHDPKMLALSM